MDFSQRAAQQPQPINTQPATPPPHTPSHRSGRRKRDFVGWLKLSSIVLLFSATILAVALVLYIAIGGPRSEAKYINKNEYQAVFLNGGQVYFGRLNTLNDQFLRINDIYYLRVNQQVQPNQSTQQTNNNDVSLVKLGCELHGPTDEMLINRDQVIFWENLKDDGQVAKAIAQYQKDNPDGQKCNTSSQSTPTSSNSTPSTSTPTTQNTTTPSTDSSSSSSSSSKKKP